MFWGLFGGDDYKPAEAADATRYREAETAKREDERQKANAPLYHQQAALMGEGDPAMDGALLLGSQPKDVPAVKKAWEEQHPGMAFDDQFGADTTVTYLLNTSFAHQEDVDAVLDGKDADAIYEIRDQYRKACAAAGKPDDFEARFG